jgi:hypothetical protein
MSGRSFVSRGRYFGCRCFVGVSCNGKSDDRDGAVVFRVEDVVFAF